MKIVPFLKRGSRSRRELWQEKQSFSERAHYVNEIEFEYVCVNISQITHTHTHAALRRADKEVAAAMAVN